MSDNARTRSTRRRFALSVVATALVAPALVFTAGTAPPSASAEQSRHVVKPRPWDKYILAPASRKVRAESVHEARGPVERAEGAFESGSMVLRSGSQVTLDFGRNIGGILNLDFGSVEGGPARIGVAFSETAKYVERESDASTGGPRGRDGTIWVDVDEDGSWTAPPELLRGAFRYVTLFLDDDAVVSIDDVVVDYTASPLMDDLRDYPNYFYSSSNLLNRLWYAGAYTTQLTTIAPTTGRVWPAPDALWNNSATVGVGDSILVDGAKRDRTVWPGDLGISQRTAYLSTGDTVSARNSIMTAYAAQKDTGELPYAGPEIGFYRSDTYHMWTLLATAEQVDLTADTDWLRHVWSDYRDGLRYIRAKADDKDLLFIDETNDTTHESRIPDGEEAMANVMYWRLLSTGSELARSMDERDLAAELRAESKRVARAIDRHLWDESAGALQWYPDRADVHPQGANSLAVLWGLLDGARADRAMEHLRETNWGDGVARTPERDDDLQLLFGSFELQAQLASGDPEAQTAAVNLMERQWGQMLKSPQGPQSTFWESMRESGEVVSSYQSYAHGWSTGPTIALTEQVLGIESEDGGSSWEVDPHTAGLRHAQGRLSTAEGPIDVRWTDLGRAMHVRFSTPRGTNGVVGVPLRGKYTLVQIDGRLVWSGRAPRRFGKDTRRVGNRLYISNVDGGKHHVMVWSLK